MKILRGLAALIALILLGGVMREAFLAVNQPRGEGTAVLRTFDATGESEDRVLRIFELGTPEPQLWVASSHWLRSWYARLHHNSNVQLSRGEDEVFESFRAQSDATPAVREEIERQMGRGDGPSFWFERAASLFAPIKPVKLNRIES